MFEDELKIAFNDYKALRVLMTDKSKIQEIVDRTKFLKPTAKLKQRIWHLLNKETQSLKCQCGSELNWNTKENKYRDFCSYKCAGNSDFVQEKRRKTCLERYGVDTNLISSEHKKDYAEKMLEKYGVDNPFKSQEVQNRIKQSNLKKYGSKSTGNLDWVMEKTNKTCLKRYNRLWSNQDHIPDESYDIRCRKEKLEEMYNNGMSVYDISQHLNIGYTQLCVHFNKLGIEKRQSTGQTQLANYIQDLYKEGEIVFNDRKMLDGKEIDIYLPELKLGIEYDGIVWHSELISNKTDYHYQKDLLAKSKGIKLIHVLDLEWISKQDIVKSRIASLLGKCKRFYARKTSIVELSNKEAKEFFIENHIQGHAMASYTVGLVLDNTLVAAMSFGKPRYNSNEYELIRFCNIKHHNVIGGASKLFKFAIKHLKAKEVVSYSDIRWGTGKLYSKLGFEHIRDNTQSYFYTHRYKTMENRVAYQKHKLAKKLELFDPNLTEWENMQANGYDRIWDCGNSVWIYDK